METSSASSYTAKLIDGPLEGKTVRPPSSRPAIRVRGSS